MLKKLQSTSNASILLVVCALFALLFLSHSAFMYYNGYSDCSLITSNSCGGFAGYLTNSLDAIVTGAGFLLASLFTTALLIAIKNSISSPTN